MPFPWPDRPMSAALTLGGKKLRKQWSACCPAHDDKSPSLIIFEGRTGAVQVRCMAGCEPIEIIAEIRWHEVADRLSMTPPPPGERPLDGTATGRVTTKEPPLTGKKVPAVLACIAEWFPQAFVPEKYLPHRPLKIGIHIDLKARCPALSERERSAVLRYYVARLMYLRACVAGAPRIDLDGNVCGEVTAAEAQHAAARLAAILAARARKQELIKSRAAAKPAAPRNKEKPPEENRQEAIQYPLERHGIRRAPGTLAKLASQGGGPSYRRAGLRQVMYDPPQLDDYAKSIATEPAANSKEHDARRAAPPVTDGTKQSA